MVRVPCLAELLVAAMAIACSRLEARAPAGHPSYHPSMLGAGLRGEPCGDVEVACRLYSMCGERRRGEVEEIHSSQIRQARMMR